MKCIMLLLLSIVFGCHVSSASSEFLYIPIPKTCEALVDDYVSSEALYKQQGVSFKYVPGEVKKSSKLYSSNVLIVRFKDQDGLTRLTVIGSFNTIFSKCFLNESVRFDYKNVSLSDIKELVMSMKGSAENITIKMNKTSVEVFFAIEGINGVTH